MKEIQISDLLQEIQESEKEQIHPDTLFAPINYLISPFNNTQLFIDNQYFLTNHQQQICKEILSKINQKSDFVFSISGQAGTGKTLLTYHIAKNLMQQDYKVAIVHCASLNNGIYIDLKIWDGISMQLRILIFNKFRLILLLLTNLKE